MRLFRALRLVRTYNVAVGAHGVRARGLRHVIYKDKNRPGPRPTGRGPIRTKARRSSPATRTTRCARGSSRSATASGSRHQLGVNRRPSASHGCIRMRAIDVSRWPSFTLGHPRPDPLSALDVLRRGPGDGRHCRPVGRLGSEDRKRGRPGDAYGVTGARDRRPAALDQGRSHDLRARDRLLRRQRPDAGADHPDDPGSCARSGCRGEGGVPARSGRAHRRRRAPLDATRARCPTTRSTSAAAVKGLGPGPSTCS